MTDESETIRWRAFCRLGGKTGEFANVKARLSAEGQSLIIVDPETERVPLLWCS